MPAAKPAIVGAFVLTGAALGAVAILLFGGMKFFTRTTHAVVYFPGSVAGLAVGAPVTFRGVRVGSVAGLAVHLNVVDLTARIPVYLDFNPAKIILVDGPKEDEDRIIYRLLKAGLRAQLDTQSFITGALQVDLDLQPGIVAEDIAYDPDRPQIPAIPSKFQTLEEQIAALPIKEISENLQKTLVAIARVADQLADQVGPVADGMNRTLESARTALEDIDRLAVAGKSQLAVSGAELGRVLASSDKAVKAAGALVASIKETTAPGSRMMDDLQATIRDLAAGASSLRAFAHEVERNPGVLISGRKPQ